MDDDIKLPPKIDILKINYKTAIKATVDARENIFKQEREKTYIAISNRANKGAHYLEYTYPENCNTKDLVDFQTELTGKGFVVNLKGGMCDVMEISWYPKG